MDYFSQLDVLGVLAQLIAAVPDAAGPTLMALGVTLCVFVFVDRAVDASNDDRAR